MNQIKRMDIEHWLVAQGCSHMRSTDEIILTLPDGAGMIKAQGTEIELDNWLVGFYMGWKASKGELK